MSENLDGTRPPLPLEDVARAAIEMTGERSLESFAARFLEDVRRWAAPSAVLAAVRDPAAESGWRLLPALCVGSGPLGAARSVRQLVEELPEDLARPSLVLPRHAVPGVKARENCLVPWSCERETGVLVLRGVAPARPANLAEAVALLAAPLWPRLLGGPAERVESSVAELRKLAERLRDDVDREVERLQAARQPAVPEAPAAEPVDAGRPAETEQQLSAARREVDELNALVGMLRAEAAGFGPRLLEEQRAAVDARAVARAAEESLTEARQQEERLNALIEELRAEKAAAAQQKEKDRAAEEAKVEEAGAAARAADEGLAAARKELGEAEASVARLILEREELRQQVTTLEKALGEVEEERDGFHREVTRLESRLHALGVAQPAADAAGAEPAPLSSETVEALRRALAVMRRTPFLPPPLRVAAQEAEAIAAAGEKKGERWARVVILDRDTPGLEPLAGQLEAAGLDVKIASYPEELALLLKTPDGRDLDAAICDVLAFRPDQNVAGIFRGWQKDRAGLALYLSFSRDSSPEVERAQRVPLSLTKGRFQRPLDWTELMETFEPLRRPPAPPA